MKVVRMRAALSAGFVVGAATLALLGGGAQSARAQANDPWRVKIGGWIPSNGDTRSGLGYSFLTYGVGYDIRTTKNTVTPRTLEIYTDIFSRDKTTGPDSFRVRSEADLYSLGLSERFYFTPETASEKFYVGAGLGGYYVRAKVASPTGDANRYKFSLGGKFTAGAELRGGVFGEASYDFVPEPSINGNRVKLSGTELRLGYRF